VTSKTSIVYPIIVDTRGEKPTVEAIQKALPHVPVIEKKMETGDIVWYSGGFECVVGVERKEANDLLNSLPPSTRLMEQLQRMVETYPIPILLVQGDAAAQIAHLKRMQCPIQWTRDGIDDYLLSWQMAGIYLTTCIGNGLGERIRLLYNWSQRKGHLKPRRKRQLLWTGADTGRAEALAALVPGLGITRAQSLSEWSIKELSSLSPSQWKAIKVEGLGETMKKKLYDALTAT